MALPAEAQIYTWRDASGHLVLSNKPRGANGHAATYAAPGPDILPTATKPPSANRSTLYDDLIRQHATTHGLSPDLVRAVIQAESNFNRFAISPKGAMGLMQLMPATARELGVEDPFQPDENIRGGVSYLARLMARYDQRVELALAAYNAGPASVERYGAVPPYRETRDYVRRITSVAATTPARPPQPVLYRWVEVVNGQTSRKYSNIPPRDVPYETVAKR